MSCKSKLKSRAESLGDETEGSYMMQNIKIRTITKFFLREHAFATRLTEPERCQWVSDKLHSNIGGGELYNMFSFWYLYHTAEKHETIPVQNKTCA